MGKSYELRLGNGTKYPLNGGISLDEETLIDLSQSPYDGLLNMCLDNGGTLGKRQGQEYILSNDLEGHIQGVYSGYQGTVYFVCKGKFYKLLINSAEEIPSEVGLSQINDVSMFMYNSTLYILDGENYCYLDTKENKVKKVIPYNPLITINKKPDGSDTTVNESFNLLGNGFREGFNADGTSTTYHLSYDNLSNEKVSANVNGTIINEGSGLTVDRTKGIVTFSTAPSKSSEPNNVEITAYKVFTGNKELINNCSFAIEFSNRLFISGNKNYPNKYFAGGLSDKNDGSYFPTKYTYQIAGEDAAITGFKVHQNTLVVFKENMICTVEASTGLDNAASFPIKFLNTEIGCDIPKSIQTLGNNIVFANSYGGVYVIASTYIIGEKSVSPISYNINGNYNRNGLLNHSIETLKKATSVDFGYKYYLNVGDRVYVLDYSDGYSIKDQKNNKWFIYDNINSNCFFIKDNTICYGCRDKGNLVRFINRFNDFGSPINAVWKSKLLDFGVSDYLKLISNLWVTFSNNISQSEIKVYYHNENGTKETALIIPSKKTWSWDNLSWDSWSWSVRLFDNTLKNKVRLKKINYFQIEFSNNTLNEDMSIKNLVIEYRLIRKVK